MESVFKFSSCPQFCGTSITEHRPSRANISVSTPREPKDPSPKQESTPKANLPHFEPKFHFIYVGTDSEEAIQKHAQKELRRRKRWNDLNHSAREATGAKKTFDQFITQSKDDTPKRGSESNMVQERSSNGNEDNQKDTAKRKEKKSVDLWALERRGLWALQRRGSVSHREERNKDPLDPWSLLGAGMEDPFDSLPCEPKSGAHFQECKSVFIRLISCITLLYLPGSYLPNHGNPNSN